MYGWQRDSRSPAHRCLVQGLVELYESPSFARCWQDEELLKSVLAYYRLMAAWLLRMASPAAAAGGQPQLPLPTPAPEHFRMLPVRHRNI